MTEINKESGVIKVSLRWPFVILGVYSVLALFLSIFWSGDLFSLFLLLASIAIFLLSLFYPLFSFFVLLTFRTTFDYAGSDIALFSIFSISVSFTFLMGVILIALAAIQIIKKKFNFLKEKTFWPWLLFLFITTLLSLFSFDKSSSLVNFFRLLSFFSAFVFGFLTFDTPKKITDLARVIIFSAIIPALVAWIQLINRGGFYDGERWRLLGTFTHPNMLAIYLVLVICLTIFVALNLRKKAVEKIFYTILAIFFVIPLLFTYTRIAWLSLAFILFFVGTYRFRKLLVFSILAFFLLYFFAPFFQDRISTLAGIAASDSSSWRIHLWQDIVGYIKENPWFGYGPGTASVFLKKNIPRLLVETEPHNDYLRIWLESGIFALLSYLWIFIDYLKRMYQGFKTEKRPRLKILFFFLILFTLSMGGASLTDNVLKDAVMQWEFWSLSGGLLLIIKSGNKKELS